MPLGAFAPLPLRLGGTATEGFDARSHARVCADLVAAKLGAFLAVFSYTKVASTIVIRDYYGQNGAGSLYAPDDISVAGTGEVTFKWSARQFTDPYGIERPINAKSARATGHSATTIRCEVVVVANGVQVRMVNAAGAGIDGGATVVVS